MRQLEITSTAMDHQGEKASALATVKNFRDISSLINTVKPGFIFRSAHIGMRYACNIVRSRQLNLHRRRCVSEGPGRSA